MILGISEAGQDVAPDKMKEIQRQLSAVIARDPGRCRLRIVLRAELWQYPEYRPLHHRIKAARRPQRLGCADRRPVAPADRQGPGREAVPAASAGHHRRWPHRARTVPVRAAGSRSARAERLDAAPDRAAQETAAAGGRRHRCAERSANADRDHQPRCGGALRHPAAAHRRHAQRCIRPAPGNAVLHQQFVLPRDGGIAAPAAEPRTLSISCTSRRRPPASSCHFPRWSTSTPSTSAHCWSPIRGNSRP